MSVASVGNEMKEEKEVMARSREKKKDKRIISLSLSLSFLDWCFCTKKDSNKKNPKEVIASKRLELLSSLSVFRDRSKTAILLLLLFGTFVSLVEEASTTLTTPGAKSSPSSSPASRTTVTTETPSWEGDSHEGLSWSFVSRNTIMGNTRIRSLETKTSLRSPPSRLTSSQSPAINACDENVTQSPTQINELKYRGCSQWWPPDKSSWIYMPSFRSHLRLCKLLQSGKFLSLLRWFRLSFLFFKHNLPQLGEFTRQSLPASFFLWNTSCLLFSKLISGTGFSFSLPRDTSLFIHRCNGIYTEVSILISFAAFFVCVGRKFWATQTHRDPTTI